ncbi:MAG: hypothetical protein AAFR90_15440 [Pseudomonadota bacterium]
MNQVKPDIIADVQLIRPEDGGRFSATPDDFFACSLIINEIKYDCRIILDCTGRLHPGEERRLGIKFLNPNLVASYISVGSLFQVWDGKVIGNCTVVKIIET